MNEQIEKRFDVGWQVILLLILTVGFLSIVIPKALNFYAEFSPPVYLTLHTSAEMIAVFVSFAIFSIGVISLKKEMPWSLIIISSGFLAAGLIDFFHTLSFPTLPVFITENTTTKAIDTWLIARYIVALTFVFAVALVNFVGKKRYLWMGTVVAVLISMGALVVTIFYLDLLPPVFSEKTGLTPFKINSEYFISIVLIAVAIVLNWRSWLPKRSTRLLQVGLILNALSEIAFTGYASVFDTVNLTGHIYKIAAYGFFLSALYIASVRQPFIDVNRLNLKLEDSYESCVMVLANTSHIRDESTELHCERVADLAMIIYKNLTTDRTSDKQMWYGFLLHDLGKIGIPDSILLKPGPLSEREWEEMKKHPQLGYEIIIKLPALKEAAQIVINHQERWDGKGYPQGLKGREISIGARAFAVADSVDAITATRPYKSARPLSEAYKIVKEESGKQFDPDAVKAFLKIPLEEVRHVLYGNDRKAA